MASRQLLDASQLDGLPEVLRNWQVVDGRLMRSVTAPTFVDGIALVKAVADVAEAVDHHPDIDIRWRTVTFGLFTHDVGGLTALDVDLADRIDAVIQTSGIQAPGTDPSGDEEAGSA